MVFLTFKNWPLKLFKRHCQKYKTREQPVYHIACVKGFNTERHSLSVYTQPENPLSISLG